MGQQSSEREMRSRTILTRDEIADAFETARRTVTAPRLKSFDFTGADLSGIDFTTSVFHGAFNTVLIGADFRNAQLRGCRFESVDLACANLRGSDLTGANLAGSNLYSTLLESANLDGATLDHANLVSAELHETRIGTASFASARFGLTSHIGLDLSRARGLSDVEHVHPSAFDSDTFRLTANGMAHASDPERSEILRFFLSAGVDEQVLSVVRSWIGKPIEFFSAFISHSSLDKMFARRLYDDLRGLGVKCWFDEKQVLPGDDILTEIDRGVRMWDRLILICSRNSLSARTGWWVEQELQRALDKERKMRDKVCKPYMAFIPITIDDFVFSDWDSPNRATVLARHVGDFRNWKNADAYADALEKLKRALDRERDSNTR